jgi:uncharacterized protein HemX
MGWVAALAAVAGVTNSIVQGEQQRKAANRNRQDQEQAQRVAETRATQETQEQEQQMRRLNPKLPDFAAMLTGRGRTSAPTLLGGSSPGPTQVSRPTLLGQ